MSNTSDGLLSEYIDIDVFAEDVGRDPRTVRRWMNLPDGLPFVKLGNRLLIRRESAKKWIAAQERHPNSRSKRPRQYRAAAEAVA